MQVNTMGFDVVASYIALPRTVQTRDAGGPKKGVGKQPRAFGSRRARTPTTEPVVRPRPTAHQTQALVVRG